MLPSRRRLQIDEIAPEPAVVTTLPIAAGDWLEMIDAKFTARSIKLTLHRCYQCLGVVDDVNLEVFDDRGMRRTIKSARFRRVEASLPLTEPPVEPMPTYGDSNAINGMQARCTICVGGPLNGLSQIMQGEILHSPIAAGDYISASPPTLGAIRPRPVGPGSTAYYREVIHAGGGAYVEIWRYETLAPQEALDALITNYLVRTLV